MSEVQLVTVAHKEAMTETSHHLKQRETEQEERECMYRDRGMRMCSQETGGREGKEEELGRKKPATQQQLSDPAGGQKGRWR